MSFGDEEHQSGLPSGVLTFLFTDIEGSTRLAHDLGDAWLEVLDAHHCVLREAFVAHGGREVSTAGDSFFVVFVDALDAIEASITMQRSIAAHDWSPHKPIRVRMGIHTGEATLHDDNYAGLNVHAASRVESAASGGQVLISGATLAAAGTLPSRIDVLDLGPHRLKDLPAEVQLYQLVAEGLAREFAPVRGIDIAKNNVPVPPSSFVGRGEVLAKLHGVLDDNRLLTLVGPGGSGKTRLSLKLAEERLFRHKDGVWFIELETTTDKASIASEIAQVIGLSEDPSRPLLDVVVEHLSDLDTLLVLDNCEHVIDDAAAVIDAVARSGHGVRVLSTSREPLRIEGERTWPVQPMRTTGNDPSKVEAVELLADRIGLVCPDFALDEQIANELLAIAQQLDGLPLALELAAATASFLELDEIIEQLEDRFGLLTHGTRTASDRQKTLRGAIEWSYGLLQDDEQALFRRLSVFPGDFDDSSVAGVFDQDLMVVAATMRQLAAKSLITVTASQRFRLLESIRAFARTTATEKGEHDDFVERHARWFATGAVDASDAHGWAHDVDGLEIVHDDLVAALAWTTAHDPELSLALLVPLQHHWKRRGRWTEGRELSARTLRATAGIMSESRHIALGLSAGFAISQGDLEGARSLFEQAIEVGRSVYGDDRTEVHLGDLGLLAQRAGDLDDAERLFRRALTAARSMRMDAHAAVALIYLANNARLKGDVDSAWELANEALVAAIDVGMDRLTLSARILVGTLAHERGDLDGAREAYRAALESAAGTGDTSVVHLTYRLGVLERDSGDLAKAAFLLTDAITQGQDLDARADLAESIEAAASVIVDTDPQTAARLIGGADRLRDEISFPRPPAEQGSYDALRDRITEMVGSTLAADEALGRTWSLEIAVNAALEALTRLSTRVVASD